MVDLPKNPIDLSIVIPSMNEYKNLSKLIPALKRVVESIRIRSEILIIEADKNNREVKGLEDNCVKILFQSKKGFANAITTGFSEAKGEYIITMDADFSHDPVFVSTLWRHRKNADVVIAGPGDLYTTVLPVIMVPDILSAIRKARAEKFFIEEVFPCLLNLCQFIFEIVSIIIKKPF